MPIELKDPLRLNDQVLTRYDWLPEDVFPELDELRDEHHKLLDEAYAVRDESIALRRKYEAEDEARKEALLTGDEPPSMTGSAGRKDALGDAEARLQAKWDVVAEFVNRALDVIKGKGGFPPEFPDEPNAVMPPWRQEIAEQLAVVNDAVEAAKQLLREAEAKEAGIKGKERWLNTTVKAKGGVYLAASQVGPVMTREEWSADKMPASMSGIGMVN